MPVVVCLLWLSLLWWLFELVFAWSYFCWRIVSVLFVLVLDASRPALASLLLPVCDELDMWPMLQRVVLDSLRILVGLFLRSLVSGDRPSFRGWLSKFRISAVWSYIPLLNGRTAGIGNIG